MKERNVRVKCDRSFVMVRKAFAGFRQTQSTLASQAHDYVARGSRIALVPRGSEREIGAGV